MVIGDGFLLIGWMGDQIAIDLLANALCMHGVRGCEGPVEWCWCVAFIQYIAVDNGEYDYSILLHHFRRGVRRGVEDLLTDKYSRVNE